MPYNLLAIYVDSYQMNYIGRYVCVKLVLNSPRKILIMGFKKVVIYYHQNYHHPVVVVKTLVNRHSAPVLQMLKKFLTPAPFHTHVLFFFSLFQCSQGEKESQSCDESHISGPEKICAKPEKKVVALLLLFKRLVFLLQCWLYLQQISILFWSNYNIHVSSCGLCFWASVTLIDRF